MHSGLIDFTATCHFSAMQAYLTADWVTPVVQLHI